MVKNRAKSMSRQKEVTLGIGEDENGQEAKGCIWDWSGELEDGLSPAKILAQQR